MHDTCSLSTNEPINSPQLPWKKRVTHIRPHWRLKSFLASLRIRKLNGNTRLSPWYSLFWDTMTPSPQPWFIPNCFRYVDIIWVTRNYLNWQRIRTIAQGSRTRFYGLFQFLNYTSNSHALKDTDRLIQTLVRKCFLTSEWLDDCIVFDSSSYKDQSSSKLFLCGIPQHPFLLHFAHIHVEYFLSKARNYIELNFKFLFSIIIYVVYWNKCQGIVQCCNHTLVRRAWLARLAQL